MRFTEIIAESVSPRLKDLAKIATNMPDADFWLVRKGSDKTVGKPVKEFDPSRIGVKVVRTDVIDPNYLYYVMMNLHNQGMFARLSNGTTNLVNITVADIANIPIGQQEMTEANNPVDQAAVTALQKKHGWSTGRTSNGDLYFTWQGRTYVFYGERMRIILSNDYDNSVSVVWGMKPNWQGRGNNELSFAQAVQQKLLKFDLSIWQQLDRRQINDSQALEKFKQENERQAREAIAQGVNEDWQKVNKKDKTSGMSRKAVKAYRRENPGSKLKTAVTTKPSKLKKGSKAANRRKSFCARMSGMKKSRASAKTKRDPDSPINKALRRWNCESIEQMQELVMLAEQKIRNLKK